MDKIPYAERVRLLAEKMAKNQWPLLDDFVQGWKKACVNAKMQDARIAVAEMKDMAACLLHSRFIREGYLHAQAGKMVDKELKFQGLIPDTEQEAANNE